MKQQNKKYFDKGFTLIELMVTVAIIAILAAIAIPSYLGIQKKAARSEAKSNLQAIALALEGYFAENNDYGPTGLYTYRGVGGVLGSMGHPGRLAQFANLGGDLNYEYRVRVFTAIPPVFGISAIPFAGNVANDSIVFGLRSDGTKEPLGTKW